MPPIIATGHRARMAAIRGAAPTCSMPARRPYLPFDPRPAGAGDPAEPIMAAPRRIGILTGGGDVPGLNAVIKSVVYRATDLGYEVLGIRRGWEGLTHQRRGSELDPEYVRVLDRVNTRTIDRTGGTILHSSRTNPRKMQLASLPSWVDPGSITDKETSAGVFDLTDHV